MRLYNVHEVAELIAEAVGDTCACNVNSNDEWLAERCELQNACCNVVGAACWEQWLKWRENGGRKNPSQHRKTESV